MEGAVVELGRTAELGVGGCTDEQCGPATSDEHCSHMMGDEHCGRETIGVVQIRLHGKGTETGSARRGATIVDSRERRSCIRLRQASESDRVGYSSRSCIAHAVDSRFAHFDPSYDGVGDHHGL
jgi:hypothetical protein